MLLCCFRSGARRGDDAPQKRAAEQVHDVKGAQSPITGILPMVDMVIVYKDGPPASKKGMDPEDPATLARRLRVGSCGGSLTAPPSSRTASSQYAAQSPSHTSSCIGLFEPELLCDARKVAIAQHVAVSCALTSRPVVHITSESSSGLRTPTRPSCLGAGRPVALEAENPGEASEAMPPVLPYDAGRVSSTRGSASPARHTHAGSQVASLAFRRLAAQSGGRCRTSDCGAGATKARPAAHFAVPHRSSSSLAGGLSALGQLCHQVSTHSLAQGRGRNQSEAGPLGGSALGRLLHRQATQQLPDRPHELGSKQPVGMKLPRNQSEGNLASLSTLGHFCRQVSALSEHIVNTGEPHGVHRDAQNQRRSSTAILAHEGHNRLGAISHPGRSLAAQLDVGGTPTTARNCSEGGAAARAAGHRSVRAKSSSGMQPRRRQTLHTLHGPSDCTNLSRLPAGFHNLLGLEAEAAPAVAGKGTPSPASSDPRRRSISSGGSGGTLTKQGQLLRTCEQLMHGDPVQGSSAARLLHVHRSHMLIPDSPLACLLASRAWRYSQPGGV